MNWKAALRMGAVLALTGGLVAWFLSGLDLQATWAALTHAHPALVAVAALGGLGHLFARSFRWRALLDVGREPPPYRELLVASAIGFAVTFTAPGRLGEVIRPALLSMRTGVPLGASLASCVFERLLDMATLITLLLLFVLAFSDRAPEELVRSAVMAGVVATVLLGILIVVHRFRRNELDAWVARLATRLPGRFAARGRSLGLAFLRGFDSLLRPGAWWRLPALSLMTWSTSLLVFLVSAIAAGAKVPLAAPLLLVPLSAIGIAIPTPAGIGGFHAVSSWGMESFLGVDPAPAAATAVIAHAASVVPIILAGLFFFWREDLSVGALREAVAAGRAGATSDEPGPTAPATASATASATDDEEEPDEVEPDDQGEEKTP